MASVRRSPASSEAVINTLLAGTAWSGPVTFGFAGALTGGTVAAINGTVPSAALAGAVADAFAQVSAFTNLSVRWASSDADIRVIAADGLAFSPGHTLTLGAYAFFPAAGIGGDAAFGPTVTADLAPGSYGFRTVLHEIGHALGLKHPHEPAPYGALAAAIDSPEHSVMSARSHPGASLTDGLGTEPGGFSRTYMPADIAALQHLYGANFSDPGNTHYRFDPFERVTLHTIWDGGGHDTYDFSRHFLGVSISLLPGGHSMTGQEPQLNRAQELSRGDAPVRAEGAIHNAFLYKGHAASLIEDAIGGWGADTVIGNGANNRLDGRAGSDLVKAGRGNDVLIGRDGDDTLAGDAGNDHLFGENGNDAMAGGSGDDFLSAGGHDDRIYGGDGNDTLIGGWGADLLDGGAGADRLDAGSGADFLVGGSGNDTLDGGAGADRLIANGGDDLLLGGDDNDALFAFEGDDTLLGHAGNDRLDGGAGHDRMNGGDGRDHMVGGSGDDLLLGEAGDDWLIGSSGNDTLAGGDGADAVFGFEGDDVLYGNADRDRLDGGAGNDRILGGTGHDWILGGDGNDTLHGETGADNLFGGDGDDVLVGGEGFDRFVGGAGADTVVFATGGTLRDMTAIDRIDLPVGVAPEDARQAGADVVFDLPGGGEIVLENFAAANLFGAMFV